MVKAVIIPRSTMDIVNLDRATMGTANMTITNMASRSIMVRLTGTNIEATKSSMDRITGTIDLLFEMAIVSAIVID